MALAINNQSSHLPTPTHYAYAEIPEANRLCQGDVLDRTDDVVERLRQFHNYYAEHKSYTHFMVLTQSCDLIKRDDKTKAQYIAIAPVRPIEDALLREAKAYQDWWQLPKNVVGDKAYSALVMFVQSLIDNNQPNYFFLHEDVAVGLTGHHCAFLNLSISLRTEHYDDLLKAKRVQLQEPFQAKLGWLVGNLYSRVGTEEYDNHHGPNSASKLAAGILNSTFLHLSDAKIGEATRSLEATQPLTSYSPNVILEHVEKAVVLPPEKRLAYGLKTTISRLNVSQKAGSAFIAELKKDDALRQLIRDSLAMVDVSKVDDIVMEVERRLTSKIAEIAQNENIEAWNRLTNKLIQSISTDEVIKRLLR